MVLNLRMASNPGPYRTCSKARAFLPRTYSRNRRDCEDGQTDRLPSCPIDILAPKPHTASMSRLLRTLCITLLLAFVFLHSGKLPKVYPVFAAYTLVTTLLVLSIFTWKIFPECFIEGRGLTPFKVYSEYVICTISLVNIYLLGKNREKFEGKIFHLLMWSMLCTIISELAFTFYISNYGFSNLVGHYFKIFSFFLVYQAIIKTGIEEPFELVFRDLNMANISLTNEIKVRKKTERQREELISELKAALDEIKTLRGILPICSHCKKIRDDKGSWNQLEKYIHDHSDAQFSHGICPDCIKEHYPEIKLDL